MTYNNLRGPVTLIYTGIFPFSYLPGGFVQSYIQLMQEPHYKHTAVKGSSSYSSKYSQAELTMDAQVQV